MKLFRKHHRPLRASVPLQLTPNYPEGLTLCNARVRSSWNASEGSIIRFRTLNLQASARVPVDSAARHLVFIPDSYASSIVSPCFSRSYLVVDVSGRPNFRVVTGMEHPPPRMVLQAGITEGKPWREHKWGIFQLASACGNLTFLPRVATRLSFSML